MSFNNTDIIASMDFIVIQCLHKCAAAMAMQD